MAQYVKSPKCRALWTYNCYEADRKYPDRNGVGVFSLTGNFTKEGRDELEKQILANIGESGAGTYHFKSDSKGNTDVKFKAKEKIKDRHGQEIVQQPPVYFKGEKYTESFEHAFVHILYTPKLFKAYNVLSLSDFLFTSITLPKAPRPSTLMMSKSFIVTFGPLSLIPSKLWVLAPLFPSSWP